MTSSLSLYIQIPVAQHSFQPVVQFPVDRDIGHGFERSVFHPVADGFGVHGGLHLLAPDFQGLSRVVEFH